jgi:hypothetical protein
VKLHIIGAVLEDNTRHVGAFWADSAWTAMDHMEQRMLAQQNANPLISVVELSQDETEPFMAGGEY